MSGDGLRRALERVLTCYLDLQQLGRFSSLDEERLVKQNMEAAYMHAKQALAAHPPGDSTALRDARSLLMRCGIHLRVCQMAKDAPPGLTNSIDDFLASYPLPPRDGQEEKAKNV